MAKLFLSYSRKDAERAQRLADWLEREGHDVWRDEDDIGGGASFSAEIEKALKDCDAVLALWSADSVQSSWVRDEAGFGRDAGKLIPFSLDGTEPPLGFRQFQSIDLSNWRGRGAPVVADRIRRAIERFADLAVAPRPKPAVSSGRGKSGPRLSPAALAVFALVLVAAVIVGVFAWQRYAYDKGITIAVLPSPTSPDRPTATDYANAVASDMAAFLPIHFDGTTVIAPADAAARTSGYRMLISTNRPGNGADASLTLSNADGRAILWSRSWNARTGSTSDLRGEISRFASRAALCLGEAEGGSRRLVQPALGIFLSGCSGMIDSTWSPAQISATFERLIAVAPDFPPGWAYVALLRSFAAQDENSSGPTYAAVVRRAREGIATARRLNPHSGLAYLAESVLVDDDDRVGRLALLDKGVDVEPTNALVQQYRSHALGTVGRMAESVEVAKRAVELDPLSPFTRSRYILALTYAGQFSRAKADIADARQKWPNDLDVETAQFSFEYRYGDPRVAEQLMPRVLNYSDAQLVPYRKFVAARLEPSAAHVKDAMDALRAQGQNDPDNGSKQLLALGLFGKFEELYRLLADPRFQSMTDASLLFRPEFAPVRADPRFMSVAARAGLVRYWRESGNWPDFCTNEPLRYECRTEAAKYRN